MAKHQTLAEFSDEQLGQEARQRGLLKSEVPPEALDWPLALINPQERQAWKGESRL